MKTTRDPDTILLCPTCRRAPTLTSYSGLDEGAHLTGWILRCCREVNVPPHRDFTRTEVIALFAKHRSAQQEARDSLAKSARRNRALRGTASEKILTWEPFSGCPTDGVVFAKVGRGELILRRLTKGGVHYTSSFGPNSDRSFSGYLPGLTLEEAKKLVYQDAQKHW